MITRTLSAALLAAVLLSGPAMAVQPDEMLADPKLESRARDISKDLRCVVCQNESIDESNADLARDLRLLVRDRLTKGDSNDEVVQYIVDRYGDYVLLRPPFKASTYILWFGPVAFALFAILGGWWFYRSRAGASTTASGAEGVPQPLSADEQRRLEKLMKDSDGAGDTA